MAETGEAEFKEEHRNRFLKVKCEGCGNEQVVFSAPSRSVKCLVCNQELGASTGHKISLKAKKLKEFG